MSIIAAFMAGIILTVGTGLVIGNRTSNDYSIVTPKNQRAKAVLPDGTVVWLNSNTRLTFSNSFWDRRSYVYLNGEAFFDIHTRRNKVLCISTDKLIVKGTDCKLNIRLREEEKSFSVTPMEGHIKVETPNEDGNDLRVEAGKTLKIKNDPLFQYDILEYKHPQDLTIWIGGIMEFNHISMKRVSYILEKTYNVNFIFEDNHTAEIIINETYYTKDNINIILDELGEKYNFRYKRIKNNIHLMEGDKQDTP